MIDEFTAGLPAVTSPFAPLASPLPTTAVVSAPNDRDHVALDVLSADNPLVHVGIDVLDHADQYFAVILYVSSGLSVIEVGHTLSFEQLTLPYPHDPPHPSLPK